MKLSNDDPPRNLDKPPESIKESYLITAQNIQMCKIPEELKAKLKKFRFRKEKTIAALILKVNFKTEEVEIDGDLLEDCSIEEIESELPDSQPRFIVLSYVRNHSDGRQSFPLCFVYICPSGVKPELAMMYAGVLTPLKDDLGMTKVFELRDKEEFTEEWLKKRLEFY